MFLTLNKSLDKSDQFATEDQTISKSRSVPLDYNFLCLTVKKIQPKIQLNLGFVWKFFISKYYSKLVKQEHIA